MPSDAELDDSWAVTLLTGVLYVGWLSLLSYGVLWLGIEPLPTIEERFEGWVGTAAAVGVGVLFIAGSRYLYDVVRARTATPDPEPEEAAVNTVPTPESTPAPPADRAPEGDGTRRKRKKKKKKKKRKR